MNDKKRKKDTSTVKEAMESLLESYRLKGKYRQVQLVSSWERLMGKPIAMRTTNIYVHHDVLHVTLSSAPLKNELSLSKFKIIQMLEKEMGAGVIKDVVFR